MQECILYIKKKEGEDNKMDVSLFHRRKFFKQLLKQSCLHFWNSKCNALLCHKKIPPGPPQLALARFAL